MYRARVASEIANLIQARQKCIESRSLDWLRTHTERLTDIAREHLPSGSGIDNGTKIDLDKSTPDRLVLITSFHHMDEGGGYDGWTEHTVIVRASLCFGLDIRITGPNRNDIKDYLQDVFAAALRAEITIGAPEGK